MIHVMCVHDALHWRAHFARAAHLRLSEGTARNHVSAVLGKLGVSDRTQAALLALRHDLAKSD